MTSAFLLPKRVLISSVVLTLVAALGGCGSPAREAASGAGGGGAAGPGGGGAGGDSSPLAEACVGYAATTCASLSKCLPYGFSVTYVSETDCETRVAIGCQQEYGSEGSTVSAEQVTKCGDAQGGACDIFGPGPKACRFTGTLAAGAGCIDNSQCQTGFCWFNYDCEGASCFVDCGVCLAPKPSGEGCQPGQCDYGLVCSSAAVCAETVPTGAACDVFTLCENGDYCNEAGVCAPFRGIGDPCPLSFECDVNAGATCDATTKKCIPMPVPKLGESCAETPDEQIAPNCVPGAYCASSNHVCTARKAVGEACAMDPVGGDVECEIPAYCRSGRCSLDAPTCP